MKYKCDIRLDQIFKDYFQGYENEHTNDFKEKIKKLILDVKYNRI